MMLMSLTEKENNPKTTHVRVYIDDKDRILDLRDHKHKNTPDVVRQLLEKGCKEVN